MENELEFEINGIKCITYYKTKGKDVVIKPYEKESDIQKILKMPKNNKINKPVVTYQEQKNEKEEDRTYNSLPEKYTEEDKKKYVEFMNDGFKKIREDSIKGMMQIRIDKKGHKVSFFFTKKWYNGS